MSTTEGGNISNSTRQGRENGTQEGRNTPDSIKGVKLERIDESPMDPGPWRPIPRVETMHPPMVPAQPQQVSFARDPPSRRTGIDLQPVQPAAPRPAVPQPQDPIKVDEHWNDMQAGFSLITSDRVRFYVPVYCIQAAR